MILFIQISKTGKTILWSEVRISDYFWWKNKVVMIAGRGIWGTDKALLLRTES